jgi:hypothetical protein
MSTYSSGCNAASDVPYAVVEGRTLDDQKSNRQDDRASVGGRDREMSPRSAPRGSSVNDDWCRSHGNPARRFKSPTRW